MKNKEQHNNQIEDLSSYLHDLRSSRFKYQRDHGTKENIERREKQSKTTYQKLSETDKQKDRKIAKEILLLLSKSRI